MLLAGGALSVHSLDLPFVPIGRNEKLLQSIWRKSTNFRQQKSCCRVFGGKAQILGNKRADSFKCFEKANTDLSRQIKECEKEVKQHEESDQYEIDVGKHFFELDQLLKQKANE